MATRKEPPVHHEIVRKRTCIRGSSPPSQPPREISRPPTRTLSFCHDLHDDCLLAILSFLHFEDLNTFAICNRRCRDLRRHESLDQTRSATIVIKSKKLPFEFLIPYIDAFTPYVGGDPFAGNRSHLKIVDLAKVKKPIPRHFFVSLESVTRLDISYDRSTFPPPDINHFFLQAFPKLREINGSYAYLRVLESHPKRWRRIDWRGGKDVIDVLGERLPAASLSLEELYVDNSRFDLLPHRWRGERGTYDEHERRQRHRVQEIVRSFTAPTTDEEDSEYHLWMSLRALKRVSMKNVAWLHPDIPLSSDSFHLPWNERNDTVPVTQEMIIKFVRRTPTLRWIRSDLTPENVAMLQGERPEVTFVTD